MPSSAPAPATTPRLREPSRYRKTVVAGASVVLSEGALYAASTDDKSYFVIKVLKLGEGAPLIRVYSNTFAQRPVSVDASWLYVAAKEGQRGMLGAQCLTAKDEFLRDWNLSCVLSCAGPRRRTRRNPIALNAP